MWWIRDNEQKKAKVAGLNHIISLVKKSHCPSDLLLIMLVSIPEEVTPNFILLASLYPQLHPNSLSRFSQ